MMPQSLGEILNRYHEYWFTKNENRFSELTDTLHRFRELLLKKEAPFSRDCRPGHFTASCFVVSSDLNQVLLLKHKKLGKWLQMGGHCDGEINVAEVALREAKEESGVSNITVVSDPVIDLDIHWIPENQKEDGHFHFDVRFVGICSLSENLKMSDRECSDLKWFSWDEAFQMSSEESMHRVFKKIHFLHGKGVLS